MKTYNVKLFLQAAGFVTVYFSIIIYGFIWLNSQISSIDKIYEIRAEIIDRIEVNDAKFNGRIIEEVSDLERRIMPSALIGRKTNAYFPNK